MSFFEELVRRFNREFTHSIEGFEVLLTSKGRKVASVNWIFHPPATT